MFWDRPVLFAQRQGHVIEDYKSPLPMDEGLRPWRFNPRPAAA
jgi:hypothetical protein